MGQPQRLGEGKDIRKYWFVLFVFLLSFEVIREYY